MGSPRTREGQIARLNGAISNPNVRSAFQAIFNDASDLVIQADDYTQATHSDLGRQSEGIRKEAVYVLQGELEAQGKAPVSAFYMARTIESRITCEFLSLALLDAFAPATSPRQAVQSFAQEIGL